MTDELNHEEINQRVRAMRWCEIAVDSHTGVTVSSPIYKAITENRDPGPSYSSCADLAHWMLYRLGVRSKWINRKEHLGWTSQVNVSKLVFSCPVSRPPKPGEVLKRGDVMIVWNKPNGEDAHVNVVEAFHLDISEVQTWDYGQAAMNPDTWKPSMVEGCRRDTKISVDANKNWIIGSRKLQRVLPLMDVLAHCKAKGELVAEDDHDAWLTRITAK